MKGEVDWSRRNSFKLLLGIPFQTSDRRNYERMERSRNEAILVALVNQSVNGWGCRLPTGSYRVVGVYQKGLGFRVICLGFRVRCLGCSLKDIEVDVG